MYDNVKFWIPSFRGMQDVALCLDAAKESADRLTGEVLVWGFLDNMRVGAFPNGLSVQGSIARFANPDAGNIYPIDARGAADVIQKLSDRLHLDFSESMVTGLEFGTEFVMSKPINEYLRRLGDMPRLERFYLDAGSLYYKHSGSRKPKEFCFYDKMADAREKRMKIPRGLEGSNLLKYEMRLAGKLTKQLNVPEVKASTLTDKTFYRMLAMKWQQHYFSISRINQIKLDAMSEIKSPNDAFEVFVARLLSQAGKTQISGFMEELKAANVFANRRDYTRTKDKIMSVANKTSISVKDDTLAELDDAINNAVAYI